MPFNGPCGQIDILVFRILDDRARTDQDFIFENYTADYCGI